MTKTTQRCKCGHRRQDHPDDTGCLKCNVGYRIGCSCYAPKQTAAELRLEAEKADADGAERQVDEVRRQMAAKLAMAKRLRKLTLAKVVSHSRGMWRSITISGEYEGNLHIEVTSRMARLYDSKLQKDVEQVRWGISIGNDLTDEQLLKVVKALLPVKLTKGPRWK